MATNKPNRRLLPAGVALVLLLTAHGARGASWDQLQAEFLGRAGEAAGSVGVEVIVLPSGRSLWSHRALEPMIPASLLKTATSYAALKTLGPGHRFRTTVQTIGTIQGHTLMGDLWLKSEGDIFWTADRAAILAAKLKTTGIDTIRGRVRVDHSFFSPPFERVCLDDPCEDSYNPVISGTAIEFNTALLTVRPAASVGKPPVVEWLPQGRYARVINQARTASRKSKPSLVLERLEPDPTGVMRFRLSGSLPISQNVALERRYRVSNPTTFVAEVFTSILESSGIRVEAPAQDGNTSESKPAGARVLAEDFSPTLADTIYGLNRHSNNFMAEMLLRSIGAAKLEPPGTEVKGIATVNKVLKAVGADTEHCVLKTGSGLSRACRMPPRSFSKILVAAYSDTALGAAFMDSMAVNGQEGTMRRRLNRSSVTIRGKTGTLKDVAGFAGYVSGPGRPTYAVVIILNEVHHLQKAKESVDSFLENLALGGPNG